MAHAFPSQIDDFTVLKRTGRAVCHVIEGHHDANLTVCNLGFRCCTLNHTRSLPGPGAW